MDDGFDNSMQHRQRIGVDAQVRGLAAFPGDHVLMIAMEAGVYRHPARFRIEPARATFVEVHVELASGSIVLVDEDGEPMAGVSVQLAWADDPEQPIKFETTSEAGELGLTLSPGNYVLIVWAPEAPEAAGSRQPHPTDGQRAERV